MYIAIDLGGTKTLVVLFGQNKEIIKQVKFETPKDYRDFLDELKKAKDEMSLDQIPQKGAIGTRGILDRANGLLITDSILPWKNVNLSQDCSSVFGCEFVIENDSKLAGLSEARLTDGNYKKVLYITISTGIGSALITDNQLNQDMIDSEIGKWLMGPNNPVTWENVASGKWITETFGMRASELEDDTAWQKISEHLAIGFVNAIAAYNPELIIVGGGVGTHFDKYSEKLIQVMSKIMPDGLKMPQIVEAKHPEEAVIFGCYELIKN